MSGDIKPGVYLDLPESEYFAADALGSTDLKALERDPLDWWAGSRLNPSVYTPKPRADANDSLALGKAIHTLEKIGMQCAENLGGDHIMVWK